MVVVLMAGAIGFVPFWTIWDDGNWPLTVTVRSTSGSAIRAVSAEALDETDSVRYFLDQPIPPDDKHHSASQTPFVGEPLIVNVPTSSTIRGSLLWSYTRYYQYRKLVVVVEYQDGKREGRVVDIPDLHKNRMVTMEVP